MKRIFFVIFAVVLVFTSIGKCGTISEKTRTEYGHLKTAIETSASVIKGEYGKKLPAEFDTSKFLQEVEGKIPFYSELSKYSIIVQSKGNYYLLIAKSPDKKSIILFDFSCSTQVDGLVYLYPEKYDTNNLDQYDPCKTTQE